jgi:hypothetical protein
MAYYLWNRMPIGPEEKCLEEAFTGRKPSIEHLYTFGCIAYGHIPEATRDKVQPTGRKIIFVGYQPASRQYQLYDPLTENIIISSSPTFAEDEF